MRLVLLFFVLSMAVAGCKQKATATRGFDKEKIAYYNASEAYNYDKVIIRKPNPVLNFFLRAISLIARFFNTVLGYILLAALAILLIWIVARYVNQDRTTYTDSPEVLRVVDESSIDQIDFSKLIARALEQKDYRLAIRFSFLDLLKRLSTKKLIKVKEGKTNFEYYAELPPALRPVYRQALAIFEYVWYGEFVATEATYHQLTGHIQQLGSLTKGRQHA